MSKKLVIAGALLALIFVAIYMAGARDRARAAPGRVTLKSSETSVSFGAPGVSNIPAWIPVYSGSAPEGIFNSQTREERRGTYSFKTADPAEKVAAFFEQRLKADGYEVDSQVRGDAGILTARMQSRRRTVVMTVDRRNGMTQASVLGVEKK